MSATSSQKQTSSQGTAKFANANLNSAFASRPASTGQQGFVANKSGLLVLKRPRTAVGGKLSVPRPVNLPSIKKEHAGNDPSTQLVPTGTGSGSWSKPEEAPPAAVPEVRQPTVSAVSNWAVGGGSAGGPGAWQPPSSAAAPGQPPRAPSSYPDPAVRDRDRQQKLNPDEYPSLADAKEAPQIAQTKGSYRSGDQQQDSRSWADDERGPVHYRRGSWDGRHDRDDRPGGERFDEGHGYQRGMDGERGYGYDDARRGERMPPPPPPRPYPGGPGGSYDRYDGGAYADPFERNLFPPPPPPRVPPPPHRPDGAAVTNTTGMSQQSQSVGGEEAEAPDLEKQAFEAELELVAADLAKKKRDDVETERLSSQMDADHAQVVSEPEVVPQYSRISLAQRSATRASTELDEEDKRRKDRAAEKLRALEQQISQRGPSDKGKPAWGNVQQEVTVPGPEGEAREESRGPAHPPPPPPPPPGPPPQHQAPAPISETQQRRSTSERTQRQAPHAPDAALPHHVPEARPLPGRAADEATIPKGGGEEVPTKSGWPTLPPPPPQSHPVAGGKRGSSGQSMNSQAESAAAADQAAQAAISGDRTGDRTGDRSLEAEVVPGRGSSQHKWRPAEGTTPTLLTHAPPPLAPHAVHKAPQQAPQTGVAPAAPKHHQVDMSQTHVPVGTKDDLSSDLKPEAAGGRGGRGGRGDPTSGRGSRAGRVGRSGAAWGPAVGEPSAPSGLPSSDNNDGPPAPMQDVEPAGGGRERGGRGTGRERGDRGRRTSHDGKDSGASNGGVAAGVSDGRGCRGRGGRVSRGGRGGRGTDRDGSPSAGELGVDSELQGVRAATASELSRRGDRRDESTASASAARRGTRGEPRDAREPRGGRGEAGGRGGWGEMGRGGRGGQSAAAGNAPGAPPLAWQGRGMDPSRAQGAQGEGHSYEDVAAAPSGLLNLPATLDLNAASSRATPRAAHDPNSGVGNNPGPPPPPPPPEAFDRPGILGALRGNRDSTGGMPTLPADLSLDLPLTAPQQHPMGLQQPGPSGHDHSLGPSHLQGGGGLVAGSGAIRGYVPPPPASGAPPTGGGASGQGMWTRKQEGVDGSDFFNPMAQPQFNPNEQHQQAGGGGNQQDLGPYFRGQPFVPTNKMPDWSTGPGGATSSPLALMDLANPFRGGVDGGAHSAATAAGMPPLPGLAGFPGQGPTPGPPGQMSHQQGGKPDMANAGAQQGGGNYGGSGYPAQGQQQLPPPPPQGPQGGSNKDNRRGPWAMPSAVGANLPDDIFGLDSNPNPSNAPPPPPGRNQGGRGGGSAQRSAPDSSNSGKAGLPVSSQPPPSQASGGGGSRGKPEGGRGRGRGRGPPPTQTPITDSSAAGTAAASAGAADGSSSSTAPGGAPGGRGGGGRGFSGRNGRGAGRAGAAAAATSAATDLPAQGSAAKAASSVEPTPSAATSTGAGAGAAATRVASLPPSTGGDATATHAPGRGGGGRGGRGGRIAGRGGRSGRGDGEGGRGGRGGGDGDGSASRPSGGGGSRAATSSAKTGAHAPAPASSGKAAN
eukprot:gene25596-11248_t